MLVLILITESSLIDLLFVILHFERHRHAKTSLALSTDYFVAQAFSEEMKGTIKT